MSPSRDRLLQQCTVKLVPADSKDWGTGCWVTPNCILTCAHVVEGYDVISVWWRGQAWATARVKQTLPLPVDLALLQFELPEGEQPPCVLLNETFNPFDRLYVYGYPDDFPDGGSVTIQCEGDAQEQGVALIKAQAGQVRPGHSGSPALNWETGQVCGVVSDTRSRSTDLGGLLIPVSTIFSHFPDIQAQNRAAHSKDSLWFTLPLQALAVSQPRSPVPPPQFSTYNPATFAGRSAETVTLTACLRNSCRILVIVGMTGIGKTALAERVVANVMDATESVTLPYCRFSLENLSLTPDFASSGAALLRELGEEPTLADQQDSANLVEHILQQLNRQPCRLQIDSLERLLRGNEQEGWSEFCDPLWLDLLQKFLASTDCPSQLILTSQDIPGDLDAIASRYPQFWHCEPLQGLNPDEQRTLFQNLGLTPTDVDWELLHRIGTFYDGHPLVLQVIAEEIRQHPFQGNIRQYWHHYEAEFTTTAPATASRLERSRLFRRRVRQRVEQTIQRLPEPARQMLCASAVFRRPVPIEFWYAMLSNGDPQTTFNTLQERNLVEYVFGFDNTLLVHQHNLIRSVTYEQLRTDISDLKTAEHQAILIWLKKYSPSPQMSNLDKVRGFLEAFHHCCNIEEWNTANYILSTVRTDTFGHTLDSQLGIWGFYQEQINLNRRILGRIDLYTDSMCLHNLSIAYRALGQYENAVQCGTQHIGIADKFNDSYSKGVALSGLGNTSLACNQYTEALKHHHESLEIYRRVNSLTGMGIAFGNVGNVHFLNKDYEKAKDFYSRALEISLKTGDLYSQCKDLANLGNSYQSLGNHMSAEIYYRKALQLSKELGDKRSEAKILGNIGILLHERGANIEASEYIEAQISICRQIEAIHDAGVALCNLGEILLELGDYDKSHKALNQASILLRKLNDSETVCAVQINLTKLYKRTKKSTQAIACCEEALALATELGIPLKAECEALLQQIEASEGNK